MSGLVYEPVKDGDLVPGNFLPDTEVHKTLYHVDLLCVAGLMGYLDENSPFGSDERLSRFIH